tara:strand:+ start:516 stop:914 length:399 start_codon:yes stop_codon:yes gene_type:complete
MSEVAKDCAPVVIVDQHGKYMLQFRDDTPGINHPLMWGFFGGQCEDGETPGQCASRELHEELVVEFMAFDFEELASLPKDNGSMRHVVRLCFPIVWGEFALCEGAGVGYFTKDEALKLNLVPGARVIFEEVL